MANSDETFVKYVLQTGMATDAQIAAARKRLNEGSQTGTASTISEVMVREGIITTAQRETVEKKLKAQSSGIQQLDNYKLIKKLGEGGMGSVYLAEDTVAYRKVALKVLSRKFSTNPEFLGRFRREAQALGRLNHPNIVAGFNVGENKGYQYYVMEYCDGEPLDKRLRREKQLDIYDAIQITIQVARGLQYAHEHNTIHRDIKPGNLVATSDGLIKILDMGLSKTIGEADSSFNTQAGVTVGTPHYISPEQARGDQAIDGRTDIYSLGATLYHLITGRTPFDGPTSVVIMTKHLNDQLANPADLRPDCPQGLIEVITRMMAKKADDRYLNCAELVEDLEHVAAGKAPSSPALDPIHSSIGMRSLRVGTGKYKPVGDEREASAPSKRATGKREPVAEREGRQTGKREPVAEREGRQTGKREPVAEREGRQTGKREPVAEREGRSTGKRDPVAPNESARVSTRKSGQGPVAQEREPVVDDVNLSPQSRRRPVSKESQPVPPSETETAPTVAAAAAPASESSENAAAIPAKSAGLNYQVIGGAIAAAIVLGSVVLYFAFSGKKSDAASNDSTHTATTTGNSTSPVVDTKLPVTPVVPTPPPPVTPVVPVPPPPVIPAVVNPPVVPAVQAALNEGATQVETLTQQRNYPRAKSRLDELEREVAEKDTYNATWCPRLDGLDRAIQNGEQTLKQEFKKQLIGPNELPPMPAGALLLFNSAGTDPRVKWSPRTIKFFTGKLPWVDGQTDSKTLSFEAPDNLLSPGPNGRIVLEYSATTECDAVVKFQDKDDKWKELPVTLPPGRLKKVEVSPGGKFISGMSIKSIAIEFTNTRDDILALYRIYVFRQ